jgi:hypothetical protein
MGEPTPASESNLRYLNEVMALARQQAADSRGAPALFQAWLNRFDATTRDQGEAERTPEAFMRAVLVGTL